MGAYSSETVEPNQSFLGGIIDAALPDEFGITVSVGTNRVQRHDQPLSYGIGGRAAGYITVSEEDAESYFEGIDVNVGGMAGPYGATTAFSEDGYVPNVTVLSGLGYEFGAEVSVSYGLGLNRGGFYFRTPNGSVNVSDWMKNEFLGFVFGGSTVSAYQGDDGYDLQTADPNNSAGAPSRPGSIDHSQAPLDLDSRPHSAPKQGFSVTSPTGYSSPGVNAEEGPGSASLNTGQFGWLDGKYVDLWAAVEAAFRGFLAVLSKTLSHRLPILQRSIQFPIFPHLLRPPHHNRHMREG